MSQSCTPYTYIYLHSYPCFLSVEKALQDVNDEKMTQLSRRRSTKKGLLAPTATCRSPKRKKIRRYEAKPRNNPTVVCLTASAPLSQEEQTTNLLKSLTSRISTCRCVYISCCCLIGSCYPVGNSLVFKPLHNRLDPTLGFRPSRETPHRGNGAQSGTSLLVAVQSLPV